MESSSSSFRTKFIALGVGNAMEFFDFAIFGAFADIIGKQFFPNDNSEAQILKSLSIFGAAFVMRPLGKNNCVLLFSYITYIVLWFR